MFIMKKFIKEEDFLGLHKKNCNLKAKVTTFHFFKNKKIFSKQKDFYAKYYDLKTKDDFINIFKKATLFVYDEIVLKNYLISTRKIEIFKGQEKIGFIDFSNELFNIFLLNEFEYYLILLEENFKENIEKIYELQKKFNNYYETSKKIDLSFYYHADEYKKYLKKMYKTINFNSKIVKRTINSKKICFKLLKINGEDFEDFEDFDAKYFIVSQGCNHLKIKKNTFLDLYLVFCEKTIDEIISKRFVLENDYKLYKKLLKNMLKHIK